MSVSGLLAAHAADSNAEAMLACANEQDDARRLRCFDSVVAGMRRAPAAPTVAAAPAPASAPARAPAPAAASAEDKFGARGDVKPEELQEITAKVTAISIKPYGEHVVTLDNGQVWVEIQTNSRIKLKTGDTVKIETGALNSFRLIAPNGRSSKVSRLR